MTSLQQISVGTFHPFGLPEVVKELESLLDNAILEQGEECTIAISGKDVSQVIQSITNYLERTDSELERYRQLAERYQAIFDRRTDPNLEEECL